MSEITSQLQLSFYCPDPITGKVHCGIFHGGLEYTWGDVAYLVEADSFSRLTLWKESTSSIPSSCVREWEQGPTIVIVAGDIGGFPVKF